MSRETRLIKRIMIIMMSRLATFLTNDVEVKEAVTRRGVFEVNPASEVK